MSLAGRPRPCGRNPRQPVTPLTDGDRLLRYAIANQDQELLYTRRGRAVALYRLKPGQWRRYHKKRRHCEKRQREAQP